MSDGEIFSALPLHDLSLRTPLLRAPESGFPVPLLAPIYQVIALFVRVNYEHSLIFSQIQRASTLYARGNQLRENTRVLAGADFHPLARPEKNEGLPVIY